METQTHPSEANIPLMKKVKLLEGLLKLTNCALVQRINFFQCQQKKRALRNFEDYHGELQSIQMREHSFLNYEEEIGSSLFRGDGED